MSKIKRSAEHRLVRLLDTPVLSRVVPHLAPETLHRLIQDRGLEACGELLTAATPAQLTSVLDLDLWRHARPGQDEQFDVGRFGEWLEMLVDTGEAVAARTIAALDAHLVIAGLSRYLRVFDPGTFEPTESTDDERTDRHEKMHSETSRDMVECEVGGYLVRARRPDAWDAIVTFLVTLETEHHDYFHAVMQGCRRLSNSTPEIDGLDDLLTLPEQHLHDAAIEREQRQSRLGYVMPAEARAFLQQARQSQRTPPMPMAIDPSAAPHAGHEVSPRRPRALLSHLMAFVLQDDEATYLTRGREIAFLANTLLAGCSIQSRPFTPKEASEAAASICNLGLEYWSTRAGPLPDAFLVDHDLVTAFEAGWSVLYQDVSLFVADRLLSTLADLHCEDADTRRELLALERALVKHRGAGTPWLARDAADVLAPLDMTVWVSVLGLLDECPILPATLAAVLEARTTPVSPTAFEFISTPAQIGDIRVFMGTLPGLLSR
jgi:hypothetical protein